MSLWWDESIVVDCVDSSKNFIDAQCRLIESQNVFQFSGIYETSYRAEKAAFWRGIINDFHPFATPWICG